MASPEQKEEGQEKSADKELHSKGSLVCPAGCLFSESLDNGI